MTDREISSLPAEVTAAASERIEVLGYPDVAASIRVGVMPNEAHPVWGAPPDEPPPARPRDEKARLEVVRELRALQALNVPLDGRKLRVSTEWELSRWQHGSRVWLLAGIEGAAASAVVQGSHVVWRAWSPSASDTHEPFVRGEFSLVGRSVEEALALARAAADTALGTLWTAPPAQSTGAA